jgi:hypothetical protein
MDMKENNSYTLAFATFVKIASLATAYTHAQLLPGKTHDTADFMKGLREFFDELGEALKAPGIDKRFKERVRSAYGALLFSLEQQQRLFLAASEAHKHNSMIVLMDIQTACMQAVSGTLQSQIDQVTALYQNR